jgi:hypothetical protein
MLPALRRINAAHDGISACRGGEAFQGPSDFSIWRVECPKRARNRRSSSCRTQSISARRIPRDVEQDKKNMASRFYHYISDAKLDMLFDQIPLSWLDGMKAEIGFDFAVLKGKVSAGDKPTSQAREAKVQAVEKLLTREGKIEEIPREGAWLRASFNCCVGFLENSPGLVLFGGTFEGYTLLLAGSSHHLISGSPGTVTNNISWSFVPHLLQSIRGYIDDYDVDENEWYDDDGNPSNSYLARKLIFGAIAGPSPYDFLARIPRLLPGPSVRMHTLCRIFCLEQEHLLALGSPLYVYD